MSTEKELPNTKTNECTGDNTVGETTSARMKEIADAFNGVDSCGNCEVATDPSGLWEDSSRASESWTASFSRLTVSECNNLLNASSINSNGINSNVLPPRDTLFHSTRDEMVSAPLALTVPLLSAPTLKSPTFQLHDQQYINRLGK